MEFMDIPGSLNMEPEHSESHRNPTPGTPLQASHSPGATVCGSSQAAAQRQQPCPHCQCGKNSSVLSPAEAEAIRKLIRMEMQAQTSGKQENAVSLPPYVGSFVKSTVSHFAHLEEQDETPHELETEEIARRPARLPPLTVHTQTAPGSPLNQLWGMASPAVRSERHHNWESHKFAVSGKWTATTKEVAVVSAAEEDQDDDDWQTTAENAYGAFIHTSLQSGFFRAVCLCGPMVVVSVLIQFTFSYELFQALPWASEEAHVTACQIPSSLQLAAVGVFVTLMLNNVPGMLSASYISLGSSQFRLVGDDDKNPSKQPLVHQLKTSAVQQGLTFLCAVATEIVTWSGIFISGVLFILTSQTVDLVIRSTVAILFVQNVDEVIFDACCPDRIKDNLRNTRYKKERVLARACGVHKASFVNMLEVYSLFVHLPVLALISACVVFGLRAHPSFDCLEWTGSG